MVIDGVEVVVLNKDFDVDESELAAYVARAKEKYPNRDYEKIKVLFDGDNVELTYNYQVVPFERIRRITGYLVGTMERWNDAKTAEEHDRVKHSVEV